MRRIDLFCKLLGPLFISLVTAASTLIAIWTVLGMNVASVLVEYICIARVRPVSYPPVTLNETHILRSTRAFRPSSGHPLEPLLRPLRPTLPAHPCPLSQAASSQSPRYRSTSATRPSCRPSPSRCSTSPCYLFPGRWSRSYFPSGTRRCTSASRARVAPSSS